VRSMESRKNVVRWRPRNAARDTRPRFGPTLLAELSPRAQLRIYPRDKLHHGTA